MERVAVSGPAHGAQALAVVIERSAAVDDLLHLVAVDVGDADAMRALAAKGAALRVVGRPGFGQLTVAVVPRRKRGAGVHAAPHDRARPTIAAYEGDRCQEAIDSIAVAVAPSRDSAAVDLELFGSELDPLVAAEHGDVFGSAQNVAVGVAVVGRIIVVR